MLNPKRTRILPGNAEGLGYGVCVHNMVAPQSAHRLQVLVGGGHPAAEYARRDAKAGRITVRSVWRAPHGGTFSDACEVGHDARLAGESLVKGN